MISSSGEKQPYVQVAKEDSLCRYPGALWLSKDTRIYDDNGNTVIL